MKKCNVRRILARLLTRLTFLDEAVLRINDRLVGHGATALVVGLGAEYAPVAHGQIGANDTRAHFENVPVAAFCALKFI